MDIKEENLLEAYKSGCQDVKKTLERLFPDFDFGNKPPKLELEYRDTYVRLIAYDETGSKWILLEFNAEGGIKKIPSILSSRFPKWNFDSLGKIIIE